MAKIRIYLAKIMIQCKFLQYFTGTPEQTELLISGSGVNEVMSPMIVDRPNGTNDRLLMFFADPVVIGINGVPVRCPGHTAFLWRDRAGHYYGNQDKIWRHSWIHFHGTTAERLISELNIPENTLFPLPNPAFLEHRLHDIFLELTGNATPQILLLQFELFLRELARACCPGGTPQIPDRLLEAKNRLSNLQKHPTLPEIARNAGMSIPHFSAMFQRCFHVSPLAYHKRIRMDYAKHLLRDKNLQISEIAEQCGFSDLYSFSRAFKRHFGMSPSDMRKKEDSETP